MNTRNEKETSLNPPFLIFYLSKLIVCLGSLIENFCVIPLFLLDFLFISSIFPPYLARVVLTQVAYSDGHLSSSSDSGGRVDQVISVNRPVKTLALDPEAGSEAKRKFLPLVVGCEGGDVIFFTRGIFSRPSRFSSLHPLLFLQGFLFLVQ